MKNLYNKYLALSGWAKFGVWALILSVIFFYVHASGSQFLAWTVAAGILVGVCYVVYKSTYGSNDDSLGGGGAAA